ncbi:HypC/HybG/HupF family hydrogenase formation chaperone [Pseudonocardia nigra]|uniref:HypC/HybG/HupF family hydrogenase formation chaperone n=1 Tax=Pseudonocardia nigra TaxID=1921578 RepID=UPI001C6057AD|nr:HypC/HybG/HupF family hydrogenase formation chaperone [Pseudonocardia nigra]
MCLGVPGRIVEITDVDHQLAVADVEGVRRKINIGLLVEEEVIAGDWVLIHVGFAMSKIDEAEAEATLALLAGMGDAYTDELDALFQSRIE